MRPADAASDAVPEPTSPAQTASRVVFDAILHPHRSLSRRGFFLVMAVAVGASLTMGTVFLAMGAWPIFGFYGLDVLILYLALRQNFRSARIYERVHLTPEQLTVEKGDMHGPKRVWTFLPHWLRVNIDDPVQHESQLTLSSHGRSLVIGAFLTPEERLDFARALCQALEAVRRPLHLGDAPA